jgi:hypothetical protein
MERVGENGFHLISEASGLATLIEGEKLPVDGRILPLLEIIVGQHAIPRVANNGKLKVVGKYLWAQFLGRKTTDLCVFAISFRKSIMLAPAVFGMWIKIQR